MSANLAKKNLPATNSFRLNAAREALTKALATKKREDVTVMHAWLYQDNVRVYYRENGHHQKHCKIMLDVLIPHVAELYGRQLMSDQNAYMLLEEKTYEIVKSYLEVGKEVVAL